MSIMPEPFSPALHRDTDPNNSNTEIINKLQSGDSVIDEDSNPQPQQCFQKLKTKARNIVQNINFQIFITVFTIASLFMQDLRIIFIDMSADTIVDTLNIIFIVIFMSEIILSFAVPGYINSFFFYLDILSTLSIVMDISMLTNLLYSSNTLGSGVQLSMIIRNSKASRAAARTVRVMKIFRLARIVKLYKSATKAKELKSKKLKEEMDEQLKLMKMKRNLEAQSNAEKGASYGFINSQAESHMEIESGQGNFISKLILTKNMVESGKAQKVDQTNEQTLQPQPQLQQSNLSQTDNQTPIPDSQNSQNIEQIQTKMNKTESKISKLLSDNTMKKIILVILLLMFSVPALDTDNYYQQTSSWDFLTDFIASVLAKPEIPIEKINALIMRHVEVSRTSQQASEDLILFSTPYNELYSYDAGTLSTVRVNDLTIAQTQLNLTLIALARNSSLTLDIVSPQDTITIILNCREFNQIDSWFSIAKILFICVGIIYILNTFNENISMLITEPIERMLEDVKNNGKADFFQELAITRGEDKTKMANNYETTSVHLALTNISNQIYKFFGVKGKQSIYKKIFQPGTVSQNYLSTSKKSYCILGLCTIENYYQISHILKDEILNLNRQVSEYLHTAVYRYGGHAVMNYEGAFLVAFQCPGEYHHLIQAINREKLRKTKKALKTNYRAFRTLKNLLKLPKIRDQSQSKQKQKHQQREPVKFQHSSNYINILSDFAIFSLVKTIVKINKQAKFYKYRKDAKLMQALGDNFQIKINCILHAGWVREGFLGSNLKIDYFYFGGLVQELKRIAHYCRKVSNELILTHSMYQLVSPQMRRYTRIIDTYHNPSHNDPEQPLYLVDLNLQNISPPKNISYKKTSEQIAAVSLKRILNLEYLKDSKQMERYKASSFIGSKKELREVLKNVISEQFRRKYILAYDLYIREEYYEAKEILEQLCNFNKDDRLVNRLMNLIGLKLDNCYSFVQKKIDWEIEALFW